MTSARTVTALLLFASGCAADVVDGTQGDITSGGTSGSYEDPGNDRARRPPPVITSMSPLAGDYGTEVTIIGDNFDGATLSLAGTGDALTFTMSGATGSQGEADAVVTRWSSTEIRFKYPFPASGPVRVTSGSGTAEGGTFVPSFDPGAPLAAELDRASLLAVVSPDAGTTVAAFDGARGPLIVVARPDGTIESRPFDRGSAVIRTMSLYVTAAGTVDGFFSREGKLWQLTDAAGAASTTSTGVTAAIAAGGRDVVGPYAWIKDASSLSRLRPPSWTAAETVPDPTPASAPGQSIAVATDDSLIVGWGVNSTGSFPFYDHTTRAVARRLPAGASTFDSAKSLGGGADDYMSWTRFLGGPEGRIASYFCASDTGAFSSATVDCREGYAGNGIAPPSSSVASEYVVGFNATAAVAASCEVATATIKLGPETQTAEQVPVLFPCPPIVAVSVDPAGAGQLLVRAGTSLYAPRKR